MTELLKIGVFPIVLTFFAFQMGRVIQEKTKLAICNPILLGVVLVIVVLKATAMPLADYQQGVKLISWLITPATVCLAVPMYEQLQVLRKNLVAILAGIVSGALSCLAVLIVVSLLLGLDKAVAVSLLPKGITTAIGLPLSELYGGYGAITTIGITVAGLSGYMFGPTYCRWFHITDPVAQGVAFGTASHVMGTSRANELDALTGAVSSLSLVVAGLMTAVIFPVLYAIL